MANHIGNGKRTNASSKVSAWRLVGRYGARAMGLGLCVLIIANAARLMPTSIIAAQQPAAFNVKEKQLTLEIGEERKLTITPAEIAPDKLIVSGEDGVVTFDKPRMMLIGQTAGKVTVKLTFTPEGSSPVTHEVAVLVSRVAKVIAPEIKPILQGTTVPVEVSLLNRNDQKVAGARAELSSNDEDVVEPVPDAPLSLLAKGTAQKKKAKITVRVQGELEPRANFDVEVLEAVQEIALTLDNNELSVGETRNLGVTLKGALGGTIDPKRRTPLDWAAATCDGGLPLSFAVVVSGDVLKLDGRVPGRTCVRLTATSSQGVNGTRVFQTIDLIAYPKGESISFESPNNVVTLNGTTEVTARVKDGDGLAVSGAVVDWEIVQGEAYKNYVALSAEGNVATLHWFDDDDDFTRGDGDDRLQKRITLKATYKGKDRTLNALYHIILLRGEIEFALLKVWMQLMDDHTAKDLFGKRMADEYYVARVRLNNNLKDDENGKKNEFVGASILAFSDSLEVGVMLEKQYDPKLKSEIAGQHDQLWHPVDPEREFDDLLDKTGISAAQQARRRDALLATRRDRDPLCKRFVRYRPHTFEMMVNTVDRRDERSTRTLVFRLLRAAGTAASFGSSVAATSPGVGLPLALEKYANLLLPGMERIWPNLKETHRQNIVSMTMKQLEQIPYGSDVSRVLFFPKQPFNGLLRGHKTRIAQLCPFYFKVEVAVVQKRGRVTAQPGQ